MNKKKLSHSSLNSSITSVLAALLCILIGLVVGFLVLLAINPAHAWGDGFVRILKGGFHDAPYGVGKELANAAPLIMTGLSVAFAFKTGLKGSVVFMADLMRAVSIPCSIDFMVVSSYGGSNTVTSGLVKIIKDLDGDLSGKDVLIVEDILDTGVTLSNLVPMLKMRNPNSVKICTILDKPSRRKADIQPDYEGFQVPDEFVVGYGLDYDEKYRNLPYVGVLKPEVYEK